MFALQHGGFVPREWLAAKGLFHSFFIRLCLKAVNPSTPKSMLFLVEERLESVNLPDGTLEAATPQSCLLIKKCSDPSDLRITPRREPSSSLSKSQAYPFWVVVALCSTVAPDSIHVPVIRSVMVHGNLSWSGGVVETPVAIKY